MKNWKSVCCATAKKQLEYHCDQHGYECPDQVLRYYPIRKNYHEGLPDRPAHFSLLAANGTYAAKYCPWCGGELKRYCIPPENPETVAVKKIKEQTVEVFNPDGVLLGDATYQELNDVRIQIKQQEATGYYIKFGDKIIRIDKKGNLESWPKGMHDWIDDQLMVLTQW